MNEKYPIRPQMSSWFRYPCIGFGILIILGGIKESVQSSTMELFQPCGAFLVGGVWLAFGLYGGLPLVDTVRDWRSVAIPDEIDGIHRKGLLVMRRCRRDHVGIRSLCSWYRSYFDPYHDAGRATGAHCASFRRSASHYQLSLLPQSMPEMWLWLFYQVYGPSCHG
jgi:hypothetical protein